MYLVYIAIAPSHICKKQIHKYGISKENEKLQRVAIRNVGGAISGGSKKKKKLNGKRE